MNRTPRSPLLSNGKSAAIVLAILAAAAQAGVACNSQVTVETGGSGGAGGHAGSGGSGASATGGASTGGVSPGGSATGGASMGGAIGGSTGDGGAIEVCPGYGDACTDCLSAGCAAEWCDCAGEPHCIGYLQCLGTCMAGDTACAQSCATVHQPGISKAFLVADCAATTCDADCSWGKALTPCQHCLYSNCAAEMDTCIGDPACLSLVQCLQQCMQGDMDCSQACLSTFPDGIGEAQDIGACRMQSCEADCP